VVLKVCMYGTLCVVVCGPEKRKVIEATKPLLENMSKMINQCCGSGMGKKSGSGSGIRIRDEQPDHISQSLETIFFVKILEFFDADPGPGIEKIRIRDQNIGSATLTDRC
jgi:hypothetical protein